VIADFGITCHATTDQAVATHYARGTGGYRAPELLTTPAAFTKKVDIWALGCILYELLRQQKAFADDWGVREYYMTASIKLEIPREDDFQELSEHETSVLSQLLDRNPLQRPRVSELRPLFGSYRIISNEQIWNIISQPILRNSQSSPISGESSFPPFSQWVSIAKDNLGLKLLFGLSEWYEGRELR
jgi:serine/threonine protein kinase